MGSSHHPKGRNARSVNDNTGSEKKSAGHQAGKHDGAVEHATMNVSGVSGMGSALPAGIVAHDTPVCKNDFVVSNPTDQAAIDNLIYQKVCEVRESMASGGRLYVIMGEAHATPTHGMAQAGLLENIALMKGQMDHVDHGHVLFAIEEPYNSMAVKFSEIEQVSVEQVEEKLLDYDPNGQFFLRYGLNENDVLYGPETRNRLFQTCLRHNIAVFPVDAGCDVVEYDAEAPDCNDIDLLEAHRFEGEPEDKKVAMKIVELDDGEDEEDDNQDYVEEVLSGADPVLKTLFPDIDFSAEGIDALDSEGFGMRNFVMVKRVLDKVHAEQSGIKTIIMCTGATHVGGALDENALAAQEAHKKILQEGAEEDVVEIDGYNYEFSLCGLFRRSIGPDDKILPILFEDSYIMLSSEEVMPLAEDCPDMLIIRGASDKEYTVINSPYKESRFITKLGRSYGDDMPQRFKKAAIPRMIEAHSHLCDMVGIGDDYKEPDIACE